MYVCMYVYIYIAFIYIHRERHRERERERASDDLGLLKFMFYVFQWEFHHGTEDLCVIFQRDPLSKSKYLTN